MSTRAWRTAYTSVVGTSHLTTNKPCQDVGRVLVLTAPDGSEILVAAAADGAGSACRAEVGARIAVESFIELCEFEIGKDPTLCFITKDFSLRLLSAVQSSISFAALRAGCASRDYACTFLAAIIGRSMEGYFQIGDGAIIVSNEEGSDYSYIFWPERGEYVNSTFFITQPDAEDFFNFVARNITKTNSYVRDLAIFSDGIEDLVLNRSPRSVHSPALRPIFEWLATTEPSDEPNSSKILSRYLESPQVNQRTDDDKTLVMATRSFPKSTVV